MTAREMQAFVRYDRLHSALMAYLYAKVDERDWHAVSDAANDLRVMEAKYEVEQAKGDVR